MEIDKPIQIIDTPVLSSENDSLWDENIITAFQLSPKPVLVVTDKIPDDSEKDLLDKILAGCKINPNHINHLYLQNSQKLAWHLLKKDLDIRSIILFGVDVERFGITAQLMPHQTNRFDDCNWIPTFSLRQIIQQPEIKSHLWNYGLKPVFVDKIYG